MRTARILTVLPCVRAMALRRVSMVRSFFVIAALIVLGSFAVMLRSVRMMLRRFAVVFSRFFGHRFSPVVTSR